ncbi:DUF763 domain-containing protein [Lentibacillus songyuanensis]|uniref:DUF763 domain-containing protein n=1 Tax=Lentibacillus songyuanensis TaxID=3136161 RepID=UPI003862116C
MANAPLHGGHCPPWLFTKMKELGASIVQVMVMEYGTSEVLRRLSDPVWFQSFGSVLGFDWHSSGLTTVVCGALKEGLRQFQGELGLFLVGGKGKASRRTPVEIAEAGEKYGLSNDLVQLQQTSRTVAKVDSAAVQDGYQLYHHFLVFDRSGDWAVIQQGMNGKSRYARRYHWLSEDVRCFTEDPHKAVCGVHGKRVLNLVSGQNHTTRLASVEICREKPDEVKKVYDEIINLRIERKNQASQQLSLFDETIWDDHVSTKAPETAPAHPIITMPDSHPIPSSRYLDKILYKIYDKPPKTYQQLLETEGVGPSTLRALAMVAEVTHGTQPSFHDPVRYAFAHGGKDGYPFPVQRGNITQSLSVLRKAIEKGKMGEMDKLKSLRRLADQENRLGEGTGIEIRVDT